MDALERIIPFDTILHLTPNYIENVTIQKNVEEPQDFAYPSDESNHKYMKYDPSNDHSFDSSDSSDSSNESEEIDLGDSLINVPLQIKKEKIFGNKKTQGQIDVILQDISIPTQAELYLLRKKKNKKK